MNLIAYKYNLLLLLPYTQTNFLIFKNDAMQKKIAIIV